MRTLLEAFQCFPPMHWADSELRLLSLWLPQQHWLWRLLQLSIRTPSSAVHAPEVRKLVPWTQNMGTASLQAAFRQSLENQGLNKNFYFFNIFLIDFKERRRESKRDRNIEERDYQSAASCTSPTGINSGLVGRFSNTEPHHWAG